MKKREACLIRLTERVLVRNREMPSFVGIKKCGMRQPGAPQKSNRCHQGRKQVRMPTRPGIQPRMPTFASARRRGCLTDRLSGRNRTPSRRLVRSGHSCPLACSTSNPGGAGVAAPHVLVARQKLSHSLARADPGAPHSGFHLSTSYASNPIRC